MSSDSEKLSCLKILTELQQYVLQGKRDPEKVAGVAQDIIDGLELSSEPRSLRMLRTRRFRKWLIMDEIVSETERGLLLWKYGGEELYAGISGPIATAVLASNPTLPLPYVLRSRIYHLELHFEGFPQYQDGFGGRDDFIKFFSETLGRAKAKA